MRQQWQTPAGYLLFGSVPIQRHRGPCVHASAIADQLVWHLDGDRRDAAVMEEVDSVGERVGLVVALGEPSLERLETGRVTCEGVIDDPCEHPHTAISGYDLVGMTGGHDVPVKAIGGVIGAVDVKFLGVGETRSARGDLRDVAE